MGDQERGAGASGPCRGLGQRPKTCAAAQPRKRCERPKAARNAAHSTRIVFPHPPPPLASLPSQISAFCALAARSPCICSRLRVALPPSVASAHRAHASFRSTFGSLCRLWRQVSRLLNHSRFPDGRAHGFAAPLRVALPPLAATAHRAGASLRATGLALPSGAPKPVPQHKKQALRAAKGRKKRGSFHPHRFSTSHPGPQGHHPPCGPSFCSASAGFRPPARRNQQSNPTSKGANPHDHH